MAYTQTDLDNIDSAIASGELRVQVDGREIIYRSVDDLIKARRFAATQMTAASATPSRRAYRFNFATSRE